MPALPQHVSASPVPECGEITLIETGCRLVGAQDHARTGCAKGLTLPSIRVNLDDVDHALEQHVPVLKISHSGVAGNINTKAQNGKNPARSNSRLLWRAAKATAGFLSARAGFSNFVQATAGSRPPNLLAWNCNKQTLAVGLASSGAVLLYDTDAGDSDCIEKCQQILAHQLQQQVSSLAWRPVNSSMLAVGCEGGVALWTMGKLPLAAPNKSSAGGSSPGWVTFLPFKERCRVTCLSWSPDGRYLAGSSSDCNRMMVWDVALGVGANLRLGLQPVTCLAWSPDGNYLFAAASFGRFFLYETTTWSVQSWDTPPGAAVTTAAWAPDSNVVLLAMSGSNYLVALHLVGQPPRLKEQLLPITLPGISDVQSGEHASTMPASTYIQNIAWDPTGRRLAVVLQEPHPAAGTVALFSTAYNPVVDCHLIGFMQPGSTSDASGAGQCDEGGAGRSESQMCEGAADTRSSGLCIAFASAAGKAGAVLSMGIGKPSESNIAVVRNVPMYL